MGQSSSKIDSMVAFSICEYNMELHSQQFSYSSWIKDICGSRLFADTNIYLRISKDYVSKYSLQEKFSLPHFPKYVFFFDNAEMHTFRYVDSIHCLKKTKVKNIKKRGIGVIEVRRIDFNFDTLQINVTLSLCKKIKKTHWSFEISEGMVFYYKYDSIRKDWICVKREKWGV